MWPWSKKKTSDGNNKKAIGSEVVAQHNAKPVDELQPIPLEKIGEAIIALRGGGAHFAISYAQMNGYDEKLTNPSRFVEIIMATCQDPSFTDAGIEFAVRSQLEELDSLASRPEGLTFSIPSLQSTTSQRLQQEEDNKKWAREILAEVRHLGRANLQVGFEKVNFDFRSFLMNTVVSRREADLKTILTEVERRRDTLRPLFLRAYSRGRNKYGEMELGPLYDEIQDFFQNFFPEGTLRFFFLAPPLSIVADVALSWISEVVIDETKPDGGIDFEHWCARKIEEQGWMVTVSKASGDQGADVLANKDSVSVAVQCKRYNTPIGNKAVQEAFAGARHHNADLAVVIGTGGFTRSAQELAASTDVILLDAEMISDFTSQVIAKL